MISILQDIKMKNYCQKTIIQFNLKSILEYQNHASFILVKKV